MIRRATGTTRGRSKTVAFKSEQRGGIEQQLDATWLPQQGLVDFIGLLCGVATGKGRGVENFTQVIGVGDGYADIGIVVIIVRGRRCMKWWAVPPIII
jgi:hypothetical protein